jgi:DNA (cytosine-5)-methyltransferase 1
MLRLHTEDLIVDNFAGGGGASLGIEWAMGRSPDIAVNHDAEAIAMHAANHPDTKHYCTSVWDVSPRKLCRGQKVALAWFSPDCTFHSKARGGKPFRDRNMARRRRGLAWVVVKWAKEVRPRVILLENVEEFADWGPLDDDGKPDPLRRGFTFRRWKAQLENAGYAVEAKQLRACDYGAPTTRKRLFVIARSDGEAIVWPARTHGPGLKPYRTAAECIDWSIPCPSIFLSNAEGKALGVRRPLSDNTLRRIARGIKKYVIDAKQPFIVPVSHTGVRSTGAGVDARVHSIEQPLPTITGQSRGNHALVEPFLVEYHSARRPGDERTKPLDGPLPVQSTANRFGLVAPTLIQTSYGERKGQAPRTLDLHAPLGTVVGGGVKHSLVSAFLAKHYGGPAVFDERASKQPIGSAMTKPVDTITARDHHTVVAAHVVKLRGGFGDHVDTAQPVEAPLPAITAGGTHLAEVRAFLIKFYGTDQNPQIEEPLATVTTKDRFGLVTIEGVDYEIVDIGMRMLTPRELFRAQGFPDTYDIEATRDRKALSKTAQVRMCGNSVSPVLPDALVRANDPRRAAGARPVAAAR